MKKLSGQRLALLVTLLWIMGCLSFLIVRAVKGEAGMTEMLFFVYLAIVTPFLCWFIYWLILGYTWGIYRKLLGYEEDKKDRK